MSDDEDDLGRLVVEKSPDVFFAQEMKGQEFGCSGSRVPEG